MAEKAKPKEQVNHTDTHLIPHTASEVNKTKHTFIQKHFGFIVIPEYATGPDTKFSEDWGVI